MTDPISPEDWADEEAERLCPDIYVRDDEGAAKWVAWLDGRREAIATALRAARERGRNEGIEAAANVVNANSMAFTAAGAVSRKSRLVPLIRSLLSPQAGTEKK